MLVIQSKKLAISEIENKINTDYDQDKYVTIQEFNKISSENFTARLKQANLASKSDIANFLKKTDFDNKLKGVRWSKNELNELSKKVKAISTKGLTKDLIIKLSILNGTKCFPLRKSQNYLVFIWVKKIYSIFWWHYSDWIMEM